MWIGQISIICFACVFNLNNAIGVKEFDVEEVDGKPKDYSFSYGVKDVHTGDVKTQWEKKDGDVVRGHYTLMEPDGSMRIVDYTADEKTGFHATVKHKGPSYHPLPEYPTSHKEQKQKNLQPEDIYEYIQTEKTPEIKQTYIFVPQEEEEKPQIEIHKYFYTKSPEKFSTDLSLIKPEVPIEIDLVDPHVIDVPDAENKIPDPSIKPITLESLEDENQDNNIPPAHKINFHVPEIETGFKPMKNYAKPLQIIPNTFQTNKKPITTPGLRTYATQNIKYGGYNPKIRLEMPIYRGPKPKGKAGPVQFPKRSEGSISNNIRYHRSNRQSGKTGMQLNYTKRVFLGRN